LGHLIGNNRDHQPQSIASPLSNNALQYFGDKSFGSPFMLSRVAESIFWMARYLERAENIARFIDVNLNLMLESNSKEEEQWGPLITVTGDQKLFWSKYSNAKKENVIQFLTFDLDYPNSIKSCVKGARENARSIREVISTEMWEQVNDFFHFLTCPHAVSEALSTPHPFFTKVKTHHQLFIGLCDGIMSHGEEWHFMNLGRMLERADKTSRILDVKYFILLPEVSYVGSTYDRNQWASVLKSASGLEMYRKQYHQILPQEVAAFLIFSKTFPRSIRHCIIQAEQSLRNITGTPSNTYSNAAEQRLGRLRSDLDFSNIKEVFKTGLHEFIDQTQAQFNSVDDAIFETFFSIQNFPGKPTTKGGPFYDLLHGHEG
jgi:uncharacterized alpha-E superfamily protein